MGGLGDPHTRGPGAQMVIDVPVQQGSTRGLTCKEQPRGVCGTVACDTRTTLLLRDMEKEKVEEFGGAGP